MKQREKELASLEALFPNIHSEEIRNYFERAPAETRVTETLEFLFDLEQVQNNDRIIVENQRYAQLIHDLFPVYSVHKILKKLKKYQNCADRCKVILLSLSRNPEKDSGLGMKRKLSCDDLLDDCTETKRAECNDADSDDMVEEQDVEAVSPSKMRRMSFDEQNRRRNHSDWFKKTFFNIPLNHTDIAADLYVPMQISEEIVPISDTAAITQPDNALNDDQIPGPSTYYPNSIKVPESGVHMELPLNLLLESEVPSTENQLDEVSHSESISQDDKKVLVERIPEQLDYKEEGLKEVDDSLLPTILKGFHSEDDQEDESVPDASSSRNAALDLKPTISNCYPTEDAPQRRRLMDDMPGPKIYFPMRLPPRRLMNSNATITSQDAQIPNIVAIPGTSTQGSYINRFQPRLECCREFDLVDHLISSTGKSKQSVLEFCRMNDLDRYRQRQPIELNNMIRRYLTTAAAAAGDDGGDRSRYFDCDDSVICLDDDVVDVKSVTSCRENNVMEAAENVIVKGCANGEVCCENKKVNAPATSVNFKIVSRVLEVFPDVDPDYVRRLYADTPMEASNEATIIDRLIEKLLEGPGYPTRAKKAPSPVKEVDPNKQLSFLKELLPDADPTYLQRKVDELTPEQLRTFVGEALERPNYPTMKEYLRNQQLSSQTRQYRSEFNVENYVKLVPDPVAVFTDPARVVTLNPEDVYYLDTFFRNLFNRLPVRLITGKLTQHLKRAYQTYKDLTSCSLVAKNLMKTKRCAYSLANMVCKNIPLLQELAFIEHEDEILKYLAQLKLEKDNERAQVRESGLMKVCSCCFDDEVMPDDSFCCENGCVCCKLCIVRSSEVAFGEGRLEFPCLGDCKLNFDLSTLQRFLPPNLFSKIAQKKAVQELTAAGIEDLEFCPFCDFATIPSGPPETDKIFTCKNPECLKESCRLCRESSHVPLRCDEVERDADVKKRVFIENKMTEALLRKCWKCGISFYKEEGCNKMTCSCGALMCYVCGKAVTDYKHFNGIGGDQFELCPLYSDTIKMNQENVLNGAQKAKEEIGVTDREDLKIDPASDIEKFYEDRARRAPREPYLEQLNARQNMNARPNINARPNLNAVIIIHGTLQDRSPERRNQQRRSR